MKQEILYAQPISLRAMEDNYGKTATQKALDITNVIREELAGKGESARYFYETALGYDAQDGITKRVLTNHIEGCPVFEATKVRVYPPNDTDGYIEYHLPDGTYAALTDYLDGIEGTICQAQRNGALAIDEPYEYAEYSDLAGIADADSVQTILGAFAMRDDRLTRVFGAEAVSIADKINAIIETTSTYHAPLVYMKKYHPYFVEKYIWSNEQQDYAPVYFGLVYTNLLRECPVFFPNKSGVTFLDAQHEANNNPRLQLKLSKDALKKVRAIAAR